MTRTLRTAAALSALVLLTGCFDRVNEAARTTFTRPPTITVTEVDEVWRLPPRTFALSRAAQETVFAQIADDYDARGLGPVEVLAFAPSDAHALDLGATVQEGLVLAGVPIADISVRSVVDGEAEAIITYTAADITGPDCSTTPFASGNFRGCAVQANIAQMVARPRDLIGRGGSQDQSSEQAAGAIQRVVRERQPAIEGEGLLDVIRNLSID